MTSTEAEPTFHLFEITDPAQVKAVRETLPLEIKARFGRKPIRVVGLVISTVAKKKPVLLFAGGYGMWANTREEFQDLFGDLDLPCSLPWSKTPEFIRDEYEVNLVAEDGLSEEKNHWVQVKGSDDVVVVPLD